SLPTSLVPCCVQTPPLRVNTHAAPVPELSCGPPTRAVLPSADSATELPCMAVPVLSLAISFEPCCVHTPPLRVHTHTAPMAALSCGPPTTAVLPSPDSATETPWPAAPTAPVPTSFSPCCIIVPPMRMNTHAAPMPASSSGPPVIAVFPSADTATASPC